MKLKDEHMTKRTRLKGADEAKLEARLIEKRKILEVTLRVSEKASTQRFGAQEEGAMSYEGFLGFGYRVRLAHDDRGRITQFAIETPDYRRRKPNVDTMVKVKPSLEFQLLYEKTILLTVHKNGSSSTQCFTGRYGASMRHSTPLGNGIVFYYSHDDKGRIQEYAVKTN